MESLLDELSELAGPNTPEDSDEVVDFDDIETEDGIFGPDCSSYAYKDTGKVLDLMDQDIFDEAQTTLTEIPSEIPKFDSTKQSSIPEVIDHIENFVLGFLNQVLDALPQTSGTNLDESGSGIDSHPQDESSQQLSLKRKKIEIALADRRKQPSDEDSQWFSHFFKQFPTREQNDLWLTTVYSLKYLYYPKKSSQGSLKPFAQIFRLLGISHRASMGNMPTTKRDAFYQDVALFGSQKVVDTFVDDLAATFDLERSELHIRSSSKGLICGSSIRIKLLSGEEIECKDTESTLIPAGEDIETFSIDEKLSWVLVVEKEAVFQTLVKLGVTTSEMMPGDGIIITGKGYPDVSTRHLVKSLADALPRSIPICGLVDADPYGLDILSVYKFGSRAMRHENDRLAARRIRWLGVCASELVGYGIDRDTLLPLSLRDQNKIISLLKRSDLSLPKKWKKELQHMLFTRRKAEIEVLCSKNIESDQHCDDSQMVDLPTNSQDPDSATGSSSVPSSARDCYALLLQCISQRLAHFINKTNGQRENGESQPSPGDMESFTPTLLTSEDDDEFRIEQEFIWDAEDCDIRTDINSEVECLDLSVVAKSSPPNMAIVQQPAPATTRRRLTVSAIKGSQDRIVKGCLSAKWSTRTLDSLQNLKMQMNSQSMDLSSSATNLEALFDDYVNHDYISRDKGIERRSSPKLNPSRYSGLKMEDLEVNGSITPPRSLSPNSKRTTSWQNTPAAIDPIGVNAYCNKMWQTKWTQASTECDPLPESDIWCCSTPWLARCSLTDDLHLLPVGWPLDSNAHVGSDVEMASVAAPFDTVNPMDVFPVLSRGCFKRSAGMSQDSTRRVHFEED